MSETTFLIIKAIKVVPEGKVSSYRDIALSVGLPNGARQVARILHSLSEKENLPWHRIVRANGQIAFPPGEKRELQAELLRREGIKVDKNGKVET
jgi:methylated-DNA-protein-cysteine methyltransferase-like protein